MEEMTRIKEIIQMLKKMISNEQLDNTQREVLWGHVRQLEGLVKKFRLKKMSKINRNELRSSLISLAEDLIKIFGSGE